MLGMYTGKERRNRVVALVLALVLMGSAVLALLATLQVATADQAETDRYWDAIVGNGGDESACGWCRDKWGLSWQITPTALTKAVTDPDRAIAKRAFDAMMTMKKIDVAAIEAARHG